MNACGKPPVGYYRVGMTAQQLNKAAREHRIAQDREWNRAVARLEAVMAESRRLTANRTDIPRPVVGKPRLAAARAKFRLIQSNRQPTPQPPKSATPRLDRYREKFAAIEHNLIREGFLERIAEYDHHGKLIGHRIKRSGDVASYGRFVPTAQHDRCMKMRLLESQIAQREERERGGKIGVHVLVSPHAP